MVGRENVGEVVCGNVEGTSDVGFLEGKEVGREVRGLREGSIEGCTEGKREGLEVNGD
jgi:hypothetical protein